eukprot:COSAG06_NODE_5367_length_3523_cov_2.580315_1_plen_25_part_10
MTALARPALRFEDDEPEPAEGRPRW